MGWMGKEFWSLAWIADFLRWCGRAVEDGKAGNPSIKRFGLIMTVTFLLGLVVGFGVAIGYIVWRYVSPTTATTIVGQLLSTIEALAFMLLTAVTTGYLGGKAVERKGPPIEPKGD